MTSGGLSDSPRPGRLPGSKSYGRFECGTRDVGVLPVRGPARDSPRLRRTGVPPLGETPEPGRIVPGRSPRCHRHRLVNEGVKGFLPSDDRGSPAYLLAAKLRAGRVSRDEEDVLLL